MKVCEDALGVTEWLKPSQITAEMLVQSSYTQACEVCYSCEEVIDAMMAKIVEALQLAVGHALGQVDDDYIRAVDSLTPDQRLAIWRQCTA